LRYAKAKKGEAMEKVLAIFDSDKLYAERLAEYINGKSVYGLKTVAFEEESVLAEYLQETVPEFFLCAEEAEDKLQYGKWCRQMYLLSAAPPPEKDVYTISKYQSAEQIMKKLLAGQLQGKRQQILDKVWRGWIIPKKYRTKNYFNW